MSYNNHRLPPDLQHRAQADRDKHLLTPTWPFPPVLSPTPPISEVKRQQSLRARRSTASLIPTTPPTIATPSLDDPVSPSTGLAGLIEPGTYVAFQLCPSRIAETYPHAAEAIQSFQYKKFVGLVADSFIHLDESPVDRGQPARYLQDLVINYVSEIPVDPDIVDHVPKEDLRNRIPIYPACADGEPDEKEEIRMRGEPLRTTTLFPWTNCHQWTTLGIRLTVLVEHLHDSTLKFALQEDEFERFCDTVEQDLNREEPEKDQEQEQDPSFADSGYDSSTNLISELVDPVNETKKINELRVGEHSVPAEIWMDVREADPYAREDPVGFPMEIAALAQ